MHPAPVVLLAITAAVMHVVLGFGAWWILGRKIG